MSNEAKREFVDLNVAELSVVDSPAIEEEFIVIKCNQEGNNMSEKAKEVTKEAETPAAEVSATPGDDVKVEKVEVEVDKAAETGVAEAMSKVASTVEGIAKQLGVETVVKAEEKTATPRDIVEKSLKDAGLDEEAVNKSLKEYDDAQKLLLTTEKSAGDEKPADEKNVEKAEIEVATTEPVEKSDEVLDVLSTLETAISKAKRFTPAREETLKSAVESLQKLLAALQPQTPKVESTPKNNLPSSAQVAPAGLTSVTKALEELASNITKSLEGITKGQEDLATRVATVEKARMPSNSLGEDANDGKTVETTKSKSLWGGVL